MVSDSLHSHPAIMAASDGAVGLWVRAGSWCALNLSDGYVPMSVALSLGTEANVERLVKAGLWERRRGGFEMLRHVPAARGCKPIELWRLERDDYRKKIPQWVRDTVFERDEFRCVDCAATDDLTLDHIYPWSLGGPDTVENLRVLCRSCNSSKGARI